MIVWRSFWEYFHRKNESWLTAGFLGCRVVVEACWQPHTWRCSPLQATLETILGVFFSCLDVFGLSGEKKTALNGKKVNTRVNTSSEMG
jgi:hypothetical protein